MSDNAVKSGVSLRSRPALHLLLIAFVGFAVYSNTFSVPFQWDEGHFIADNPVIRDFHYFIEPSSAKPFFERFDYETFISRYAAYMTFAINYKIHGLNVAGYHVVNLAIHILNALLVYAFVTVTFRTPYLTSPFENTGGIHRVVALFSALLFVSHPIQTEAVTYVWQRTTELAATFYIGSIVLYAKWRLTSINPSLPPLSLRGGEGGVPQKVKRGGIYFYLASLLCAILAMKTKENAFTLPVTLALYEFMFFPSTSNNPPLSPLNLRGEGTTTLTPSLGGHRRFLYLIPFFLTMSLVPFAHMQDLSFGSMGEALESNPKLTRWAYLLTSFRVMVTYLRLIFLPVNQNLDYDYPSYQSFFESAVFLSFLLLASIFGFGVYLLNRKRGTSPHVRLISYSIFWFFITLSVESSVLNLADIIFEHRMYLPSVGVFTAITAGGFTLASSPGARKTVMAAFIAAAVIFSGAAYARNILWQDRITLWEDVIKRSPNNKRAHYNLGVAYDARGRFDDAIEHFKRALGGTSKRDPMVYFGLAMAYKSKGMTDKTMENLMMAVDLDKEYAEAHNSIGNLLIAKESVDEALKHYLIALKKRPYDPLIHCNIGNAYLIKGLDDLAVKHLFTAIELNPDHSRAYYGLGKAFEKQGNAGAAARYYNEAAKLEKKHR